MQKTKEIQIRPARAGDASRMLDIIRQVFESYDMIYDPENDYPDLVDYQQNYPSGQRELFVVESNHDIAGFGAVKVDKAGFAFLSRIYIAPEYQGLGLGEKLVRFLMDEAFEKSDLIYLWTDTRFSKAHNLYTKLGFKADGRCEPLGDINESYEYYYERRKDR